MDTRAKAGCCTLQKRGKSLKATLAFRREELLYDVENYSFVEADIMKAGDEHLRHQVFDIAQDGNEDLVTRMFNLAHAECVEALYPFTSTELEDGTELDDGLVEHEEYKIELTLPADFSRSTVVLLKELVHKYFVVRVLAEWMAMTNPGSTAGWREKLEELAGQMKGALASRRARVRIRLHPF